MIPHCTTEVIVEDFKNAKEWVAHVLKHKTTNKGLALIVIPVVGDSREYTTSLGNALSFPMSVGATTVLWTSRPTPDDMFAMLKQHNPSIFYGVPTLYAAMLSNPECTKENGSAW